MAVGPLPAAYWGALHPQRGQTGGRKGGPAHREVALRDTHKGCEGTPTEGV